VLLAGNAAPALATGNTIIIKPSERNCLSTIYLGKLFKEAGFPPGVFQVVIGAGNTGALLAAHPDVNKVQAPFNPVI
jgi:acyl-CoA reductase-like NAD-dependent aldehyde dehydrogenase